MRILLAYDGSEFADATLADLKNAGLGAEAEVLVMSLADVLLPPPTDEAADETSPTYMPESMRSALDAAQQKLDEAKALAQGAADQIRSAFPTWLVSHDAQADSPAWGLLRTADEWKPGLMIVGARGHSVFGGRLILGSVSQRVLYEARCSVRVARAPVRDVVGPVRILIGVDRSEDSDAAVEAVCRRSWPKGSEVALLSVVDTVMAVNSAGEPSVAKWIEVSDEKNWEQVRELFAPDAQKLRDAGLHVEVLVRRGSPADQIIEEANTWGADCIFLGAKGTRGIDRLLLGSVSSAVAARAHCSVEVVRPMK
jgi:nucleotide-binding universal stress UspA family protein